MLGRAAFLVLVVSVISPAAQPIATQLETTFFQFLLVAVSWAWACIASTSRAQIPHSLTRLLIVRVVTQSPSRMPLAPLGASVKPNSRRTPRSATARRG